MEYKLEQAVMVFWPYDLYPYLVSHVSSRFRIVGGTPSYWVDDYCAWIKPLFVLPEEEGKQLEDDINSLDGQYDRARRELKESYIQHLNDTLSSFDVEYKKETK